MDIDSALDEVLAHYDGKLRYNSSMKIKYFLVTGERVWDGEVRQLVIKTTGLRMSREITKAEAQLRRRIRVPISALRREGMRVYLIDPNSL